MPQPTRALPAPHRPPATQACAVGSSKSQHAATCSPAVSRSDASSAAAAVCVCSICARTQLGSSLTEAVPRVHEAHKCQCKFRCKFSLCLVIACGHGQAVEVVWSLEVVHTARQVTLFCNALKLRQRQLWRALSAVRDSRQVRASSTVSSTVQARSWCGACGWRGQTRDVSVRDWIGMPSDQTSQLGPTAGMTACG